MSKLNVDTINSRTGGAPSLSKGLTIVGVTTGLNAGVGTITTATITTATITTASVGSAVTITSTGIDAVAGVGTFGSVVSTGVGTFGSVVSSGTVSASGAAGGLATEINAKASTGKAIAMAMVFG